MLVCLLLVGLLSCTGQSAKNAGKQIHKTGYYEVTYPQNWTCDSLKMSFPDVAFRMFPPPYRIADGNYVYVYPKGRSLAPIIYKAMGPTMGLLRVDGGDRALTWVICKPVELAGLKGYVVNHDYGGEAVVKEYYLEYDKQTCIEIAVKAKTAVYRKFESDFESIVQSVKAIPTKNPAKPKPVVELSTSSFQKDWVDKRTDFDQSGANSNITRFDSLLMAFREENFNIKIQETGAVISNWNEFFKWKSASEWKDLQVFPQFGFCSAQLEIFQTNLHLGEFEALVIKDLGKNKLQFEFIDNGSRIVRWELEYNEEHQLPIGVVIPLDRFLFVKQESYRRPDGKIGYDIPFIINDKLYRVKTANVKVF